MRVKYITKVTVSLILMVILVTVFVGFVAYTRGRSALHEAAFAELNSTALEKQAAFASWIQERQDGIVALARDPYVNAVIDSFIASPRGSEEFILLHDELSRYFLNETDTFDNYSEIMLLDSSTGEILISTTPEEEGYFRDDRPYFIEGKKGSFIQEFYLSPSTDVPTITGSAPVYSISEIPNSSETHSSVAVLAGKFNLNQMDAIIQRDAGIHESDDSYLINSDHLVVTVPRLSHGYKILETSIHNEAVDACLSGESGETEALDYRGAPAIFVYRWLPDHNLCLIQKFDQSEAFAPAVNLGISIAYIGLLAIIIASAISYWLVRGFSKPIAVLLSANEEIFKGNYGHLIKIDSHDEFETLGDEFNKMSASLLEKETRLANWAKELEGLVEERTIELQRSNSDLERFAYVASHDLQEPLRMISSYLQLLEKRYKDRLDSDANDFIFFAVDGANRMKTLINDLLAYSRIGTRGKEFKPVDCNKAVENVISNLRLSIEETKAKIQVEPLPVVSADEPQLEQLFQNLIGNAIKFRSPKPPMINIAAVKKEGHWVFSVKDNGIGIDPQFFDRIFIIFQRLHTREEYPGSGIGLAICKRIVERHGGRIWIESQPCEGSTFYFSMPEKGV